MSESTISSPFDLSSETAVVIGANSGIGLRIAKGLARTGVDVVFTGRRAELVKSVASEIEKMGRRTLAQPSDVSDASGVNQ